MARLSDADVHEFVHGICFKTGPPGRVGVESEWLVLDPRRPREAVPLDRLAAVVAEAGPLPAGSAITYEPGGQLELSSLPQDGPAAAHAAMTADLDHVESRLRTAGLRLRGAGLDPHRSPKRQLTLPRYLAMERYFDGGWPSGRTMMCCTASLQVCLDIGATPADAERRWRLVHRLGPLLVAAFANSPTWRDRPTGWRSTRWAIWAAMDSSRTRPVPAGDPVEAWTRYVLDARLMTIRRDDLPWLSDPGLRFGEWLRAGDPRRPTLDDLEYHLTTLFPPVRPRGWLELRMIDALPQRWWPVPVAVAAALVDHPKASEAAFAATDELWHGAEPGPEAWLAAARDALTDPGIATAVRDCFAAAAAALPDQGAAELVPLVDAYRERYVERGRCPADDGPGDQPSGGAT
ncbi:ergothioneine biosynthesis glutamate--cysteine ligase EgtA [Marinitenerispora sediminis]|uniref:Glutamate--cysteine ligase EgtA n=1 Tax=Marinitenerispora sediminis TaxID=1931232 RepID=A0A368T9W7_9ACTN|nr:ergothioneine biosynthesis glutamate--cysteine ligase EgtA [Marinitenerispora sediminis]RCV56836.1 ergothioneine biosynthesis glutamate--cysteine ligase EgtA [Marinitenerispora sediminis]RCV59011.1 ergothioneine biosynthesis glutamate--cysteine ligase EgtA [Marinitenerispora sediminis]RCV61545.1 ergothioneine biosynthesis glutamate--cysteine ligase EgtA [Marinitenerispora sediminis]